MIRHLEAPSVGGVDVPDDSRLIVRRFQHEDTAAWDDFVLAHPEGTPFYLIAWKRAIEESLFFVFGQIAVAIGLFKGFAGLQTVLWAKANR